MKLTCICGNEFEMSYSELKYCIENDISIGCSQSCRFIVSKTKIPGDKLNKLKKFKIIRYQSSDEFLTKLKDELDNTNIPLKSYVGNIT